MPGLEEQLILPFPVEEAPEHAMSPALLREIIEKLREDVNNTKMVLGVLIAGCRKRFTEDAQKELLEMLVGQENMSSVLDIIIDEG